MDSKQIQKILDLHAKWLRSIEEGERANLSGANLSRADDKKITLIGQRPFLQIGPIGSRGDVLIAFLTDGGTYVRTGCFFGPLAEFKRAVRVTHAKASPVHYAEYHAAIALIETHAKLWTPKEKP